MKTEDREERFGIIAEKKGYISWPQLLEALEIQIVENTEKGEARFIGYILCDLKFMTKLQVRDVLEDMENAPQYPWCQTGLCRQTAGLLAFLPTLDYINLHRQPR